MATPDSDAYVCLRGGLAVPVEPMILIFQLQERGFTLTQDGDAFVVQPGRQLTPDDCARLRRWKWHVLALLTYTAPEVG